LGTLAIAVLRSYDKYYGAMPLTISSLKNLLSKMI